VGLIDRIKRRLPIVGGSPPPRSPPVPQYRPAARPEAEADPVSPRGTKPVADYIAEVVKGNKVVMFMKGTPDAPACGFSAGAIGILKSYGKPVFTFDVLSDGDVREGVKNFSSWPTIPQIFVNGEFVGGADILKQLHESGDLRTMLE
jgi:monothiol glutaredoxin